MYNLIVPNTLTAGYKTKKRESLYMLLVTPLEALECTLLYERATQRPHANMY